MKFDYTKGETAKYIVNVYYPVWSDDHYYYHSYKDSMEKFNQLKENRTDVRISVYDLKNDIRKAYAKL